MRNKSICLLLLVAALTLLISRADASIVFNVDFESGNTGFSSGYTYITPPGQVENAAEYSIVTDPKLAHLSWASFYDHTYGNETGHMMVVNGAITENAKVWLKDVELETGVTYSFTAWASSVYSTAPANLEFKLGTTSLGTMQLPSSTGVWQQFSTSFVAGEGDGHIAAIDLVLAADGNDFALDDISLVAIAIPEPAAFIVWSLLGVGSWLGVRVARRRRFGPAGRRPWSPENRQAIHDIIAHRGRN